MNDLVKLTTHDSNILEISLHRPDQLNALNHDLLVRLGVLFQEVQQDATIKAILLSGSGKAFCAGADINQLGSLTGSSGLAFSRFGQSVFRHLELLGKPSLAAVSGFAFGGGCELAMAATLRICSNNAIFAQPEVKLGVIPGFGGTQRLARFIGRGRALEICLTGRRFSALEAYQWGLVNEVTEPENLYPRALSILKEIVQLGATAMESIMTVIDQGYNLSLGEALELEAAHFALCCTTADKQEGVSAFVEKRKAIFNKG